MDVVQWSKGHIVLLSIPAYESKDENVSSNGKFTEIAQKLTNDHLKIWNANDNFNVISMGKTGTKITKNSLHDFVNEVKFKLPSKLKSSEECVMVVIIAQCSRNNDIITSDGKLTTLNEIYDLFSFGNKYFVPTIFCLDLLSISKKSHNVTININNDNNNNLYSFGSITSLSKIHKFGMITKHLNKTQQPSTMPTLVAATAESKDDSLDVPDGYTDFDTNRIASAVYDIQHGQNQEKALFDIFISVGNVVGIFVPEVAIATKTIDILGNIIFAMFGGNKEEKQPDKQDTLLSLMGVAFNQDNLYRSFGKLQDLSIDIQDLFYIIKDAYYKGVDPYNYSDKKNLEGKRKRETIWDQYLKIKEEISGDLASVKADIFNERFNTDPDIIKRKIPQFYQFIQVIHVRHIIFNLVAYLVGENIPILRSKISDTGTTIKSKLKTSELQLLQDFVFLTKPSISNRLFVSGFYTVTDPTPSMDTLIDLLDVTFPNPKNELKSPFSLSPTYWAPDKRYFGFDLNTPSSIKKYTNKSIGNRNTFRIDQQWPGCYYLVNGSSQKYGLNGYYNDKHGNTVGPVHIKLAIVKIFSDPDSDEKKKKKIDSYYVISHAEGSDIYKYLIAKHKEDHNHHHEILIKKASEVTSKGYWVKA